MRLSLFRALERVSDWRRRQAAGASLAAAAAAGGVRARAPVGADASLWVFASTIGEVHAIEPFLDRLRQEMGNPPLTLISDRSTYDDAYRAKYPQAQIEQLDGSSAQVEALLARNPPRMLLVAEIPALLHDAPCRFSFATQHAARRAGASIVLVNGWLYGYPPPSRLDRIENRWFAREYAAGFDLALVQGEAVRQALIAAGADLARVHVTGNIKFDAMDGFAASAAEAPLARALAARRQGHGGPLLVAGSVTESDHQRDVIDAFSKLRQQEPRAQLVLAPRHPEHKPRMSTLRSMLEASGLAFHYRSRVSLEEAASCDLLVLDTMGELRGCYAVADAAFVGVDHNVLEPLAYGTPTFVGPGWEPSYPSYPVYMHLTNAQLLSPVPSLESLGTAWQSHFSSAPEDSGAARARIRAVLRAQCGAVERGLKALREAGLITRARD